MTYPPAAKLNDLVRESYCAQELFDSWDEGKAHYPGPFGAVRYCSLDEVVSELDAANLKLVRFVLAHADELTK